MLKKEQKVVKEGNVDEGKKVAKKGHMLKKKRRKEQRAGGHRRAEDKWKNKD